ncbi:MAG TPA: class I SAM-dependent methyltransferase [Candidatus Binatia bacterium]
MSRLAHHLRDVGAFCWRVTPPRLRRTELLRKLFGSAALRVRYRTGPRFTEAILRWMEPNRGHVMYDTWLDYALSTNLRGAQVVEMLQQYQPVRGRRALDVGCAYGGFSVAFAEAGGEAVGIDLNDELLAFAALNVADRRAPVTLARVDVTDVQRMADLGRFDFVTCSDVIEHVNDVPAALTSLAAALHPGGILHLQIPNGESSAAVLKDPHFQAFGITLLEGEDAQRYFAEGRFGQAYDVGFYLRLEDYAAMLAQRGVTLVGGDVRNPPADPEAARQRVEGHLPEIEAALARTASDERLSETTRRTLHDAVARWLDGVRAGLAGIADERDPARRAERLGAFVRRFAIDCWDIVARKTA